MSTPTVIQSCAALYGIVPGAAGVTFVNGQIGTGKAFATEDAMLNHYYEATFTVWAPKTTAQVAGLIVANLGLTGDTATSEAARIAGLLDGVAMNVRGAKVKEIVTAFEATPAAATFNAAKAALVTAVADPTYQGIPGKGVGELVFANLSADQVSFGTTDSVTRATLTVGAETVSGSTGLDIFAGTVSSLSSERTLDVTDSIDGGAGEDRASFSLKADFDGFTVTKGALKGVETIDLSNPLNVARTFSFSGVEGVERVNIDASKAAINLTNLPVANGLTVGVTGMNSGALSTTFISGATTGTTGLSVSLSNVGTSSSVTYNPGTGIETITLISGGSSTNKLTYQATDTENVVVTGSSALTLTSSAATGVKSINAAETTGNSTFVHSPTTTSASVLQAFTGGKGTNAFTSTSTSQSLISIVGGEQADTFSLSTTAIRGDATISGGSGVDTINFTAGGVAAVQPTMSGISAVTITNSDAAAFTLDASKSSDLATVTIAATATGASTVSGVTGALNLVLSGGNTTAQTTVSNTGALTVSVNAASGTTPQSNTVGITASSATDFVMNVAAGQKYSGTISAPKAEKIAISTVASGTDDNGLGGTTITAAAAKSFELTLGGKVTNTNTLNAAAATSGVINFSNTAADSAFTLGTVTKLENLTVNDTSSKAFTLTAATVPALQILNATSSAGLLVLPALTAANNVKVTGSGTTSELNITGDSIKSGGNYPLSLTIDGFKLATHGATSATTGITVHGLGVTLAVNSTGDMHFGTVHGTKDVGGTFTNGTGDVSIVSSGTGAIQVGAVVGGDVTVDVSKSVASANVVERVGDGSANGTADITAAGNLTYKGFGGISNSLDFALGGLTGGPTAHTVSIGGGSVTDTFQITAATTSRSVTVSGDLGFQAAGGKDSVTITSPAVTGGTAGDTFKIDATSLQNVETLVIDGTAVTSTTTTGAQTLIGSATSGASITGGAGIDSISSGAGVDTIDGGDGRDTINAGGGNDKISVSGGSDSITGGAGNDDFIYDDKADMVSLTFADGASGDATKIDNGDTITWTGSTTAGVDVIKDFGNGTDKLVLGADFTIVTSYKTNGTDDWADITGAAHGLIRGDVTTGETATVTGGVFTVSSTGASMMYVAKADDNSYKGVILENYVRDIPSTVSSIIGTADPIVSGGASYTGLIGG